MNLVLALILLGVTYVVGSIAIDTGHLILYFLTVLLLGMGIKLIIGIFTHGKN